MYGWHAKIYANKVGIEPDKVLTTLHTSLCSADFLIFFCMKTDNHTQATA